MRDIKFRAWDKLFDTYFKDIENLIISGNGEIGIFEGNEWLGFGDYQDRYIVEQYTGLKDKNGVDVYEGDIVRCSRGCPHKVVWEEERGGMFGGGMPGWYLSGLDEGYAWTNSEEVIGNIHQDSDLLVDDIGNDIHEFLHGGDK